MARAGCAGRAVVESIVKKKFPENQQEVLYFSNP